MPYQLVVVQGRSANQALKLPSEGVTTVGRQNGCQIRIVSSQVSRKHCELFEKKGLLLVKDLNSSNGTIVNGKRINGQQVLEAGNELMIGSVKFRVEKAEAVAEPSAAKPSDTAVAQPIALEEGPPPATVSGQPDTGLDFEVMADDDQTETTMAAPAGVESAPVAAEETTPEAAATAKTPELSEDAVADYLLNLDLDDD